MIPEKPWIARIVLVILFSSAAWLADFTWKQWIAFIVMSFLLGLDRRISEDAKKLEEQNAALKRRWE